MYIVTSLFDRRDRRDVTVAYGRQCHYCPVDALREIFERGARIIVFSYEDIFK